MAQAPPAVTVVVATHGRADLLPDLVRGLQAQTVAAFEAVIVDDASPDDTPQQLARLTADDDRFRVVRLPENAGAATARNAGWRLATARLVAFTDDDCVPAPAWLEHLLAASRDADVLQGRTLPDPRTPMTGWFDRTIRVERFSGRYETCNLLVPRDLLERLDGFRVDLRVAGEDTDLGLRAEALGARTAFVPDALVHHHVWRTGFRGYLRQRRRRAEEVLLMRENPAARRHLRFGITHGGTHLAIWGLTPVAIWALASGRPWLPAAGVAAWCAHQTWCTRERPFSVPRRFAWSLLELVGRVYETGAYAAASIRYRTLVI